MKNIIKIGFFSIIYCIVIAGYSQKVGISNDTIIIPKSLFHIHDKNSFGQIVQLTNATSGNTNQNNGMNIYLSTNFNILFKNLYCNSGSGFEFWTYSATDSSLCSRLTITNNGNIKIGNSSNYTNIDQNGNISFIGQSSYFNDLIVPVTSTKQGGSKDPIFGKLKDNGSGSQGVFCYWFADSQEEELYFTIQLPHDWKEGTAIYPHVHWLSTTDLGSFNVCWSLEYTWSNIGSNYSNTNIIESYTPLSTYSPYTAYEHIITSLGNISGTGKAISSILACRLFRNHDHTNDTYTGNAGLLFIDFHYEIDAIGSREEYVK